MLMLDAVFAVAAALFVSAASKRGSTAPKLRVVPGGKSKPKPKKFPTTSRSVALTPAGSSRAAIAIEDPPVPADMTDGNASEQGGPSASSLARSASSDDSPEKTDGSASSDALPSTKTKTKTKTKLAKRSRAPSSKQPKPLPKPKRPTQRPVTKHAPPTAAKLSKQPKRTAKQAAESLKDYLDAGGNPGSRLNRSDYVKQCQADMGVAADGVFGAKTRARAAKLGVAIRNH